MNINDLQKCPVGYNDTPLELMPNLTRSLGGGEPYIKRDDLTGIAMGGNKSRKLVRHALDNGCTALMTFGGVQTNHGRITVAAAVKYGLKPILVLNGAKPDYCSGNLLLDRLMGADIYFVDTAAADSLPPARQKAAKSTYLEECARKIVKKYEADGHKVLRIPVGGQGVIGAAGYIQAVPEILRQMKEQGISAKYLVAGYGSTGTFAGLWAGARHYKAPFEVIGIPVEPDYRSKEETAAFINELSGYYSMGFTCSSDDIRLECGGAHAPFWGVGYNEPDEVTQRYIRLLAEQEAVFADPCYTGKVFRGFVELVRDGVIPRDENAIFLHTGGAPGLWGKEHLDHMQKQLWSSDEHITAMKL